MSVGREKGEKESSLFSHSAITSFEARTERCCQLLCCASISFPLSLSPFFPDTRTIRILLLLYVLTTHIYSRCTHVRSGTHRKQSETGEKERASCRSYCTMMCTFPLILFPPFFLTDSPRRRRRHPSATHALTHRYIDVYRREEIFFFFNNWPTISRH